MSKLRVMLVDDHAVLRAGLQLLIDGQFDMTVVAEASDMREALQRVGAAAADVIVMDLSLPDGDGVMVTERILQRHPDLRVVGLTWHKDPGYLKRMLATGARGYVTKQSVADHLLTAIRTVAKGETYIDPSLTTTEQAQPLEDSAHTTREAARVSETAPGALTAEEVAVLQRVAWGHTNREIAEQLGMALIAVAEHKTQVMQKLGLRTRIDVLRYAEARGWKRETR